MGITKQLERVREQLARSEADEERNSALVTDLRKQLQRKDFDLELAQDKLREVQGQVERLTIRIAEKAVTSGSAQEEQEAQNRTLAEKTTLLLEKEIQISKLEDTVTELQRTQELRMVPKTQLQTVEDKLAELQQVRYMPLEHRPGSAFKILSR